MKLGEFIDSEGIVRSKHVCDTCGQPFDIAPAIKANEEGYENCLMEECASYDCHRDLDVIFLDDHELRDKPLVSLKMLNKRRIYIETGIIDT